MHSKYVLGKGMDREFPHTMPARILAALLAQPEAAVLLPGTWTDPGRTKPASYLQVFRLI